MTSSPVLQPATQDNAQNNAQNNALPTPWSLPRVVRQQSMTPNRLTTHKATRTAAHKAAQQAAQHPEHSRPASAENDCNDSYSRLKQRLSRIPSRSRHTRQTLYIDLWTGQHWLGLRLQQAPCAPCGRTAPVENASEAVPEQFIERELLAPISSDTARSIADGRSMWRSAS